MYRNGLKRLLDVGGALAALLLFSPVMVAIAFGILLTDPGPVIFRQKRVGANGRLFDFYKFRSMPVGTGDVPSDRLGELRLTWIGRFIRRTNLDELPQLWSVLRGDMSLVGPRPPIPQQRELIEMRRESGALACRPGLTGWAQVNSYDGMAAAKKAEYDSEYARDLSFAKDLRIVLRTFGYLLRPPPKY